MSPRPTPLDDRLWRYVEQVGWREHPAQHRLGMETDALPEGGMRSAAAQLALLGFLIETCGASRVLEIGCFTGYGTLAMALALPEHGRIVTLDSDADRAAIGEPCWREAGVRHKIDLRVGLAAEGLAMLLAEFGPGSFDLVYIDADKKNYESYFDRARELVREGGLIALDNMLWDGKVADPDDADRQTIVLQQLTARIHADPGLAMVLVPIADGMLLCRRRV